MKISGTRLGMISIIAAICLTGCTKNNDFADNCDLEIAEQVTDIIRASQRGRYDLKNCEVVVTGESKEDGDVVRRMTFLADWRRIREPEDDPLIKGMLQAMDELETAEEKEAARNIIDGYIVEMNGEPESERIETKFVAKISLANKTVELFYPFVQAGEETLVPFQEYVEENWLENAEKRMKEGHQRLISESIRMIHTEKGFYQRLRIIESKEVRHEREMGFI